MKYPFLKTAYYQSTKFVGTKQFYIIENDIDFKEFINMFPKLRNSLGVTHRTIKNIISEGYVAIISDTNPNTSELEVYYENRFANIYTYKNAFTRVAV